MHLAMGLQVVETHPVFLYFLEKCLAIPTSLFHLLVNGFSVIYIYIIYIWTPAPITLPPARAARAG